MAGEKKLSAGERNNKSAGQHHPIYSGGSISVHF